MVNDKFKENLTICVNIALIISVIVMIFQTIATRDAVTLTREQMENTLRPWIGREDFSNGVPSNDIDGTPTMATTLQFKNYGGLPALNSTGRYVITNNFSSINDLSYQLRDKKVSFFGAIMPGENRNLILQIPISLINDAENKTIKLYLIVSINYEYPQNKLGTYSIISEYAPNIKSFIMVYDKIE